MLRNLRTLLRRCPKCSFHSTYAFRNPHRSLLQTAAIFSKSRSQSLCDLRSFACPHVDTSHFARAFDPQYSRPKREISSSVDAIVSIATFKRMTLQWLCHRLDTLTYISDICERGSFRKLIVTVGCMVGSAIVVCHVEQRISLCMSSAHDSRNSERSVVECESAEKVLSSLIPSIFVELFTVQNVMGVWNRILEIVLTNGGYLVTWASKTRLAQITASIIISLRAKVNTEKGRKGINFSKAVSDECDVAETEQTSNSELQVSDAADFHDVHAVDSEKGKKWFSAPSMESIIAVAVLALLVGRSSRVSQTMSDWTSRLSSPLLDTIKAR